MNWSHRHIVSDWRVLVLENTMATSLASAVLKVHMMLIEIPSCGYMPLFCSQYIWIGCGRYGFGWYWCRNISSLSLSLYSSFTPTARELRHGDLSQNSSFTWTHHPCSFYTWMVYLFWYMHRRMVTCIPYACIWYIHTMNTSSIIHMVHAYHMHRRPRFGILIFYLSDPYLLSLSLCNTNIFFCHSTLHIRWA